MGKKKKGKKGRKPKPVKSNPKKKV